MDAAANTNIEAPTLNPTVEPVVAPSDRRRKPRRVTKLRTLGTFFRRGACSTTTMTVLNRSYGRDMDLEERAADPLAGGMMQGYQCGMIWGSTLAAGAQAHELHGPGAQAEAAAVNAAEKVVNNFRACHKHVDCLDITEADPQNKWQTVKYFLLKGGTFKCARRIARYAPQASQEINTSLADTEPLQGCKSGNCAAKIARMMGASGRHVTMAAGLAGGIGLSGGACGALGAAIWITGMQGRAAGDSNKVINARIESLKERFQEAAQYEYECSEIVGRKFDSMNDHADHVRCGGCSAILEALAAE